MEKKIIIQYLLSFIFPLLIIAFYTLLERKILGYTQNRKGPNKTSLAGFLQRIYDALKLFTKEIVNITFRNKLIFILAPLIGLLLRIFLWILFPFKFINLIINFGILFFLLISSLRVYRTLSAGWRSNSKYALLGSIRAVAQTISYEVRIALTLLSFLILFNTFNIKEIYDFDCFIILILLPFFIIWLITCLAETNRAPFDFAEGERELVRGFNIEYGSGPFAFIFISEYINILFLRFLTSLFIFNIISFRFFILIFWIIVFSWIYVWVRSSLPRIRYDKLIYLAWKRFLPIVLIFFLLIIPIYFYFFCIELID